MTYFECRQYNKNTSQICKKEIKKDIFNAISSLEKVLAEIICEAGDSATWSSPATGIL